MSQDVPLIDTFQCNNCNVLYDTSNYRFERIHKSLRRKDYPISGGNNNFDGQDDIIL